MGKRLTGTNPLAYTGVEAPTPPNSVDARKNPEPNDAKGFNVGDMWINIVTNQGWLLTSFTPSGAVWTEIATGAAAGASNFVTDVGTATADMSTITIAGGTLIRTDALTPHTVTVSLQDGDNGQIIIGSTAGSPAYGHLTSTGGSITVTEGPNTLNIEADTTGFADHYPTDSGTAQPFGGDLEILGTDNIFTSGSSNIVSVGLTNGSNGQLLIGGGSVAQWENITSLGGTVTITNGANSINLEAVSTGSNTFVTNSGNAITAAGSINMLGANVIQTSGSGSTVTIALPNPGTPNGKLLIAGGANPAWANLTSSGGSVVITNGANSINLEATGTGAGASAFVTDSGTANEAAGSINMVGGNVVTTTGAGATVTTKLTNGTNGQLIIGGGANPAWANLTSTGATVVITNGANSINLEATGMGGGASTFNTDSGAATEAAGAITIAGGTNISTSGSGSTVTVRTINSPSFSGTVTAGTGVTVTSGGLTVTAGGITSSGGLTSSGTTTLSALGNGILRSNGSGVVTSTNGTNGQILIGGGTNAQWRNLTSTDGSVTITNGANSINLAAVGGSGASTVTTFTSSGTWTKAAGTHMVAVIGWHGGGGGASGGTGSATNGGGGGGQGSCFYFTIPATFCGATEAVVVGSGGTGGAAQGSPNSAGNNGNPGTPSSFGLLSTPALANGGSAIAVLGYPGGQAGMIFDDANSLFTLATTVSSSLLSGVAISGGNVTSATIRSQGGGAGSSVLGTDAPSIGGTSFNSNNYFRYKVLLGTGGGGGGSVGGAGGSFIGFDGVTVIYPGAAAGANGADAPTSGGIPLGGFGGGGGNAGQAGGNGGFPGGGGGGGGNNGAAGGNGGDGLVIVIEW